MRIEMEAKMRDAVCFLVSKRHMARRGIETLELDQSFVTGRRHSWFDDFLKPKNDGAFDGNDRSFSETSCARLGGLRGGKKPTIIPSDAARHSLIANAGHLVQAGIELAVLPFGDSALRNAGDHSHLGLRECQHVFANMPKCAHHAIIRKRIYSSRHFIRERIEFGPKLCAK
jgi:hypothetical protein